MRCVSSATGMKSLAVSSPWVGWFQRTSASTATIRRSTTSNSGW